MDLDVPDGWTNDGQALVKTFERGSFNGAIAFVNAVAALANRLDHHPDIAVSWKEVTIRTWSHDVNAITPRDTALAREIDAL
ncbi:MAG: 4a-hydroxytetrahydrobiopterin dehydratase [Candidatus Eremiobacteraeota bacterium]|jgi:4a-hydroxytetrahydrobiopterin dehydratase|nr:4a-hydroxytetrahydrobiopterin dehydratase [Candidatus Eremiobacteraeota bacterium]